MHALRQVDPPPPLPRVCLEVECGGGVYVRTLIEDVARAVGSRGHMTALERTKQVGAPTWFGESTPVDHVPYRGTVHSSETKPSALPGMSMLIPSLSTFVGAYVLLRTDFSTDDANRLTNWQRLSTPGRAREICHNICEVGRAARAIVAYGQSSMSARVRCSIRLLRHLSMLRCRWAMSPRKRRYFDRQPKCRII